MEPLEQVPLKSLLMEAEWRIYVSVNLASLVRITTRRLDGAKPLFEPVLKFYWYDPWKQPSVKFQSNMCIQNALENVVCKMAVFCLSLHVLITKAEDARNIPYISQAFVLICFVMDILPVLSGFMRPFTHILPGLHNCHGANLIIW